VATGHGGFCRANELDSPAVARGRFRVNPLYESERRGDQLLLRLRFPSTDYEEEYGACRQYLPEEATMDLQSLHALETGGRSDGLDELIRRRVIVDLPDNYY
jgi:hypothetical protein